MKRWKLRTILAIGLIVITVFIYNIWSYTNQFKGSTVEGWPYEFMNFNPSILIPAKSTVKIALIDTGVDVKQSVCFNSWKVKTYTINNKVDNDFKHGTLLASSLCHNKMMQQKTSDGDTLLEKTILYSIDLGTDQDIDVHDLINGIHEAIKLDVDIINFSIGTYENDPKLESVIAQAIEKNILVIAAAGNDMTRQDLYPSSYPNVISVSAHEQANKYVYANNINDSIIISAPGWNIFTGMKEQDGKDIEMGGTSIASIMVTAFATGLKSHNPSMNNKQFIDLVKQTSTDIGEIGHDEYYGYGKIDYKKAWMYLENKLFFKIINSTFPERKSA